MRGEGKVREEDDEERETEKEEIRRVMRSLKEKKAAGEMGYRKRYGNTEDGVVEEWMWELCNKI